MTRSPEIDHAAARAAIVQVGGGRGFVVAAMQSVVLPPHGFMKVVDRYVITAAHCLPELPAPHQFSDSRTTYRALLGPLGTEPSVTAECLFVDSVADVAVLCEPHNDECGDAAAAYFALVDAHQPMGVRAITSPCPCWLLTLDDRVVSCEVRANDFDGDARTLTLTGPGDGIALGTSGSPIWDADGRALGLISVGTRTGDVVHLEQPLQPHLAHVLPAWVLAALKGAAEAG